MFSLPNMLIPAILFFALGFLAQPIQSDLKFPSPDLAKVLSIYLLAGIGLHGGIELAKIDVAGAVSAVAAAPGPGFGLPIIVHAILIWVVRLDRLNAAAISAHYGSVSAGTFVTAIAFLDSVRIPCEGCPVIMLAIMESPAIIIGRILANMARKGQGNGQEAGQSRVGA